MTATIRVDLPGRGYDVLVGRGVLPRVADHVGDAERAVVVTQPTVADSYAAAVGDALEAAGLAVTCEVVPDGEAAKTLDTLGGLYRALAAIPLGRRDLVAAVGGGAVGDLAGFLAATWHRGIAVVQVPTTVQAQVDAAVGGKTGINLPEGKNLVGAFHQPVAVVADVDTLATLPPRELVAGLAEVVKCGLIRDPSLLDRIDRDAERAAAGDRDVLAALVEGAVAVKAAVVVADEREAGERAHLNLGHTAGHAIETVTGYARYLHGEAVAVGLCVALRLGVRLGLTPPHLVGRTEQLLNRLGLPTRMAPLDRAALWAALARDKKARGGVRFVLLEELARPVVTTPPADAVDAALDEVEAAP